MTSNQEESLSQNSRDGSPSPVDFSYLDLPSFRQIYSHQDPQKMSFFVEGVRCAKCLWRIEEGLREKGLVSRAQVNMSEHVVEVTIPQGGSFQAVAQALKQLGYPPHPIQEPEVLMEKHRQQNRQMLMRLGVAGAASGNIMILAIAVYAGAEGFLAKGFDWLGFLFFLPVLFYSAQTFFVNSWRALLQRRASMDLPIALALGVGATLSFYHLLIGEGAIYFDSMAVLVFLLLSSRYLLYRWQLKYLSPTYLEPFLNVEQVRVWDESQGKSQSLPLKDLQPGQVIVVKPGEKIPADGKLLTEQIYVNSAVLTGESLPQKVLQEGLCYAGTQVHSGEAKVLVTHVGPSSRVGKILRNLERQALDKTPLISMTDRWAQNFTLAVLAIGSVFFAFYVFVDPAEAVKRVLALALVACPCALVFATPLTQSFSLMRAARRGFFIKRAEALEKLTQIRQVYFDKTGTLTEGQVRLRKTWPSAPSPEQAALILALEEISQHPFAQALRREWASKGEQNLGGQEVILEELKEVPGRGVQGCTQGDLYELKASSLERLEELPQADQGLSWISLWKNGEEVLSLGLGDELRAEAPVVVKGLKARGYQVGILSGDQNEVVQKVADALGLPEGSALGRLGPEDKLQKVAEQPRVLMVGDGINDALAMAKAHVSLAVHGSMETSLHTADIYLSQPGVRPVKDLLRLSRETFHVVRRNFAISATYNVAAGSAALLGWINPLLAAIFMPLASLAVLTSSFWGTAWLRSWSPLSAESRGKGEPEGLRQPHLSSEPLWPVARESL